MALINVGIHENLVLSDKTKINDKGSLELCIVAAGGNSIMDAFEDNTTFSELEQSYRFYPPSAKDFDQKTKSGVDLAKDLLKVRHQYMQYALLYASKEDVAKAFGGFKMFEGQGIEGNEKQIASLTTEAYRNKVSTNLASLFLKFLKSKKAFSKPVPFRQKFLRQSADKNFSTIPGSSFDVWIEPMTVPAEQSVIQYTEWEIENKKNLSTPVSSTKSQTSEADKEAGKALFAKKGSEDAPDLK